MVTWSRFWRWYFQPRPFELKGRGRIYEWVGIRIFKRYLPTSGDLISRLRGVRRIDRAKVGLQTSLERLDNLTRNYEARHIFGGVSMLAISWWAISMHGKGNWACLLVANMLINGYPIMLQRYNRVRIRLSVSHYASLHDSKQK